jgi:hypothetical protein
VRAQDCQPGDVVLTGRGEVYQAPAPGGAGGWSTMQPIPFFGPPGATAPDGELRLIARGGQSATGGENAD